MLPHRRSPARTLAVSVIVTAVAATFTGSTIATAGSAKNSIRDTRARLSAAAVSNIYVDCIAGSDSNTGTLAAPLRTIRKATVRTFTAGTTVWLARNCSWEGPISIFGTGTGTAPITLAAYGTGAAPTITGNVLTKSQSVLQLTGSYQTVTGVHISHAPGAGITLRGARTTVKDVEIDDVGIGVRIVGAFGSVQGANVHDLHMVVNTPGGYDDYGAVGFDIEATDAEIANSRCTNCRAPSLDFGYDGGFVEIWNYGDRLSVHDNIGQNTTGILEVGGDAAYASARNVTLFRNNFQSTHGGFWIHGNNQFGIPVTNLLIFGNTISNTSTSDPTVLGGNLSNMSFHSNTVTTPGQVSWSGAPISHICNTYLVPRAASVGYPLDSTERSAANSSLLAAQPAVCS